VNVRTVPRVHGGIGESAHRIDGAPKVQGRFSFGSDLWADGMLWGYTVRSPHAHARIRRIDVSRAVASRGVRAVLLAADVPGRKTFGLEFADQPVLAWERVRYAGEPVAVLAAVDPETARRAAEHVRIEYEPLPAVTDMEYALAPDAPRVHDFGNVVRHLNIVHGDPQAAAEIWVDGYYETGMQDQAMLGPEAGMAMPAADGGVDLYVATQWLHVDRQQVAPCLNLPAERVRLHLAGVGGAFGAREDVSMHIHIHACLLALRTGRPVRMVYGREESFFGHVHRHPSRIWMRHGARRDGGLCCVRARILMDGGAYTSSSSAVIANAATFATGPYEVPNVLIEGTCVYTNNPPCGAMRGFGAVQVCFAHEAQMDKLARALREDPVALRVRNALRRGSTLATGQVLEGSAPVREVIARCAALPMPQGPSGARRGDLEYPGGAGNVSRGEGLRSGVGFAVGWKNIGYSEGFDDASDARVRLSSTPGGAMAEVHSAAAEVGQGLQTVLAQIVRTELGVEAVIIHPANTGAGSAGSTSASRQTMMSGGAVQRACAAVREALWERVRHRLQAEGRPPAGELSLVGGEVYAGAATIGPIDRFLEHPIEATRTYHHRPTRALDAMGQGDPHVAFVFAAQRAVVDVDVELGLVRVRQIATAQDVGRAINPQSVAGQIEGGIAQGLGLAIMEEIQLRNGLIQNGSFIDYLIPTTMDMPAVVATLVEEPEPGAPFGAKGVGEPPTIVSTAAIVAAVRAACGQELNRVPIRPDDVIGLTLPVASAAPPPAPHVPGPDAIPKYAGLQAGQQAIMRP
jgi:xanthine dehydrogenase D subunit